MVNPFLDVVFAKASLYGFSASIHGIDQPIAVPRVIKFGKSEVDWLGREVSTALTMPVFTIENLAVVDGILLEFPSGQKVKIRWVGGTHSPRCRPGDTIRTFTPLKVFINQHDYFYDDWY